MPARSATNRILDIFDGIGAVFAAAGAVRNHRQPDALKPLSSPTLVIRRRLDYLDLKFLVV